MTLLILREYIMRDQATVVRPMRAIGGRAEGALRVSSVHCMYSKQQQYVPPFIAPALLGHLHISPCNNRREVERFLGVTSRTRFR